MGSPRDTSQATDSTSDTSQVTFRLPVSLALEAEEVADLLSFPGKRASRTDAFREAIRRGFAVLRAEGKVSAPTPTKASTHREKKDAGKKPE